VIDRLQLELGVIEKTGFISYFLIVADFVQHGRSKGIACVARGSAAGSIVTYLLEIANVDPIRYGLLFERFLNPERVNPPDIDIDFADDRRADVIEYVRQKYGRDAVAQIITFGTMGAKSVVRDVGRVMGLSYGECDRLAKMIPAELKMSLEKALKQSPELKQAYETEETTRELIDTAFVLEDLARNSSVHAAGVVIGPEPLVNLLPLKTDEDGALVTQYAMNPVGELGLLKMDFLGLKTLTVIRNTCEMVKRPRASRWTWTSCRWMTRRLTTCSTRRKRWACSSWNRAGCAICAGSFRSRAWSTSRRSWRCIAPARWTSFPNSSSAGTAK
jgi:DNA polymerase-3 subunit alpha